MAICAELDDWGWRGSRGWRDGRSFWLFQFADQSTAYAVAKGARESDYGKPIERRVRERSGKAIPLNSISKTESDPARGLVRITTQTGSLVVAVGDATIVKAQIDSLLAGTIRDEPDLQGVNSAGIPPQDLVRLLSEGGGTAIAADVNAALTSLPSNAKQFEAFMRIFFLPIWPKVPGSAPHLRVLQKVAANSRTLAEAMSSRIIEKQEAKSRKKNKGWFLLVGLAAIASISMANIVLTGQGGWNDDHGTWATFLGLMSCIGLLFGVPIVWISWAGDKKEADKYQTMLEALGELAPSPSENRG